MVKFGSGNKINNVQWCMLNPDSLLGFEDLYIKFKFGLGS